jgi:hypothetical protein
MVESGYRELKPRQIDNIEFHGYSGFPASLADATPSAGRRRN